jgi:pimeloyl-ACP methyl ester carboxylesterase
VLFVAGEYDEVRAETLFGYQKMVEGSQSIIIPGSGHSKATDRPEEYIDALSHFLKEVDRTL